MSSTPLEVFLPQIQCTQFVQVFRPQACKFIQQLPQRLTLILSHVSPTIKRLKRLGLAKLQHYPRPWHPISAFAVNQMADDIERAPSAFTFISERPRFREITQKRIQRNRRASEKRYCVLQVMFHHAPQFVDSDFPATLIVSAPRAMRQRATLVMAFSQQADFFLPTHIIHWLLYRSPVGMPDNEGASPLLDNLRSRLSGNSVVRHS